MDKKELNKERATLIKAVLEYKNNVKTLKEELDTSQMIVNGMMDIGLRDNSNSNLKNACIELGKTTMDDMKGSILYLVDLIDSIADILVDVYGSALKELDNKEDDK